MLLRNFRELGGPGKVRAYLESDVHRVVKRVGENNSVYEVVSERKSKSKPRVLHRNLLLPCNDLPFKTEHANNHGKKTVIQTVFPSLKRSKRSPFDAQATSDE